MRKRKRSCFISAAYGDQLQVLQRVLDMHQVRWDWSLSSSVKQPILSSIVEAIKKANFVVGVLRDDSPRDNVLLEIGMAIGLRKPMLLLRAGKTELPSELAGLPQFATDLKDEK